MSIKKIVVAGVLAVTILAGGFLLVAAQTNDSNEQIQNTEETFTSGQEIIASSDSLVENNEEPELFYDAEELQQTLDEWALTLPESASASISILDPAGNDVAALNASQSYFAASIYKLYVAYAGYQQLDAALVDPDELYVQGNTRLECLDLMIRESDSPCAEKLWNEIGKEELNSQLEQYGITDTNMVSITTTAADAASMLARITRGQDISVESQKLFLESMQTQIYRDALNAGFSSDITVYNKIGFNLQKEYHDTAIIELASGQQLVVSVLTEGVGTSRIAALATAIEKDLN